VTTTSRPFATSIARSGNSLVLSWPGSAAACQYEVHRGPAPYFAPSAATLIATLEQGSSQYADDAPGVVGDASVNYAYVVRAACGATSVDGARHAEWDFALTPGM
jgi:hypothetical protein